MFDPVATVVVPRSTIDELEGTGVATDPDEVAIEAGALDVASVANAYHFTCEASEMSAVAKAL